jgi:hypothetical protein
MYFIVLVIFLFTVIESKKSCSTGTGKRETASSIQYRHGLFETTDSIFNEEQHTNSYRDAKIEWIRNVTFQSPFVSVTTYD